MYQQNEHGIFKNDGKDNHQITNFTAEIVSQIKVHDGRTTETTLHIIGRVGDEPLDRIEVPAEQFASMNWVARLWGVAPLIMPMPNAERDAKTAIQCASKPKTIHVYKNTGWTRIGNKDTFLHAGGAIDDKGHNPRIQVELPVDLKHYKFRPDSEVIGDSFRASLNLPKLGPPEIMWPMLLATYRAAIDKADFAIHLAGRTGTFKTEVCSLFQSHFGEGMDARSLPGSWSSTANALEALCYYAKNALIVVDDFVPNGTAWQVRALQKTCDQLIRGQGNQAGRARLSDRTNLQTTYYPRGIILSTGEDVPEGHSIRARMFILDLTPGDVTPEALTLAQQRRPHYQNAMAHFINWLALDLKKHREELKIAAHEVRDGNRNLGHTRTPAMVGELTATADMLMLFGVEMGLITVEEAHALTENADEAIQIMAETQAQYLEAADPADAFVETIRAVLTGHLAHVTTRDGLTPQKPDLTGWTESSGAGGIASYKSHGPLIGWVDWAANEMLIDINAMAFLKRHAGGKLSMTRQTLLKRLKDANVLARADEGRQRNTVRVKCNGHTRHCICVPLATVLEEDAKE